MTGFAGDGCFGRGAFGQQGVKRAVFRREIFAGDALQIGGRDAFHGGEIAFGKIQIIGREPTCRRDPAPGLAWFCAWTSVPETNCFMALPSSSGGTELVFDFFDFGEDGVARGG